MHPRAAAIPHGSSITHGSLTAKPYQVKQVLAAIDRLKDG